jgi:hypothetical protein
MAKIRYKKIKSSFLLLVCLSLTVLQAQTAIPSSGGKAEGTGGSVSYSFGQVVYTTKTGSNGSVAEGVQQPFEISVVTSIEDAKEINLSISAYPNPTSEYVTLSVVDFDLTQLSYQLYDMNGKLLDTKKLEGNQTRILMSNLTPATYFLKVTDENQEVKTFKIIKN